MARISASTAASFLSSATRSASWSAARRRRSRPISSRGRILASNALAFTAVSAWGAPPEIRPTRSRCRRFTHCVRRSTSSLRRFASSRRDALRSSLRTSGRSRVCRPTSATEWASTSSFLRPLPPANTRTSAARRVETSTTRSPTATSRCARCLPTPLQPSTAQVRGRHWRPNERSSRKPSALFGNCRRARTLPLTSITTTALSRLCGSTPITTLATASSPCSELPGRREGSATSSGADPSRATPHRSVSDGQRSIRGLHTRDLPEVRRDDRNASLRLLANRRKELVDLRTQCVNRLHRDLVGLVSGGAPQALTAVKAKALLASIRPRDEMGRLRRRLAADQLADLVALDKKLAAAEAEIRAMVKRTPTGLPDVYGIGPVITATVIGEVGDVARFRDRHHFASYNGTAPDDKGSAGRPVHCVNLKANRRLNHAIHMAAITQIRNRRSPRRAYHER